MATNILKESNSKSLISVRYLLILWLVFITFYRFTILDRGALSMQDEGRYLFSQAAIERAFNGDFDWFFFYISNTQARPGDAIVHLIPAFGQFLVEKLFSISTQSPESLLVATVFNVIISTLILLVYYKLSLLLFKQNQGLALLSTVIYSLLPNANLYVRHILGYDPALLCALATIYYGMRSLERNPNGLSDKNCIILGLGAGFGYLIYPGYYIFPALLFALIFKDQSRLFSIVRLRQVLFFFVAFGLLILLAEGIARLGRSSYLSSSVYVYDNILQGDFSEGFTFLPKYLFEVEGLIGGFLLVFTLAYIVRAAPTLIKNPLGVLRKDNLLFLFSIMFLGWLAHASAGYFLHKLVFYGRLLHIYLPFMVWAVVAVIATISFSWLAKLAYAALISVAAYSFLIFAISYYQVYYPRDVLYQNRVVFEQVDQTNVITEANTFREFFFFDLPAKDIMQKPDYKAGRKLILVNFCYYDGNQGDFKLYNPPGNATLIFQGLHFFSYAAYGYEGFTYFTVPSREYLTQRKYQLKIYEIV